MEEYKKPECITHEEYWQLLGLAGLARHYSTQLASVEKAMLGITQEQRDSIYSCHTSDLVYKSELQLPKDLDELLDKLNLKVKS